MTITRNESIKSQAQEVCQIDGLECWIVPPGNAAGHRGLNGYVVYPVRPVKEDGYGGIMTYVPVHGGITYAEEDESGMVYGFDTAHHDSEQFPRNDSEWIKEQIKVMIDGIKVAAEVEQEYLASDDNNKRADLCQRVLNVQPSQWQNFGVMINLLTGKV